jgi:hypothetical protein
VVSTASQLRAELLGVAGEVPTDGGS